MITVHRFLIVQLSFGRHISHSWNRLRHCMGTNFEIFSGKRGRKFINTNPVVSILHVIICTMYIFTVFYAKVLFKAY